MMGVMLIRINCQSDHVVVLLLFIGIVSIGVLFDNTVMFFRVYCIWLVFIYEQLNPIV